MEIIERVQAYFDNDNRKPEEAYELLNELVADKKMGARTRGLLRRLGRNPKPKLAPHYDKELERFLRMQSVRKKTAKKKATAKAKSAAKKVEQSPKEVIIPKTKRFFSDEELLNLPDNVREFYDETIKLQQLRDGAKQTLEDKKTDEERRILAESIATMQDQVEQNYAALSYYKKNGQLPEVKEEEGDDKLTKDQAKDELRNARSRRSKAKSGLKNAKTDATKEKYEGKLKEAEADVLKFENLVAKLEQDESLGSKED